MTEIARLYQAFDPLKPLTVEQNDLYVDWQKTCGPDDIKLRLANSVLNAGPTPVQRLFSGHREVGKTTELLRVKQRLEQNGCFVSMLLAEEWLDLADVQAPDLIWNMVRQLVTDLNAAGMSFGLQKFREFLRHILDMEVGLKDLDIEAEPVKFGLFLKLRRMRAAAFANCSKIDCLH